MPHRFPRTYLERYGFLDGTVLATFIYGRLWVLCRKSAFELGRVQPTFFEKPPRMRHRKRNEKCEAFYVTTVAARLLNYPVQ